MVDCYLPLNRRTPSKIDIVHGWYISPLSPPIPFAKSLHSTISVIVISVWTFNLSKRAESTYMAKRRSFFLTVFTDKHAFRKCCSEELMQKTASCLDFDGI